MSLARFALLFPVPVVVATGYDLGGKRHRVVEWQSGALVRYACSCGRWDISKCVGVDGRLEADAHVWAV